MSWALVAGGSKGLGLSIAEALAKRQYNLLLIARKEEDLLKAKDQLQDRFNIRVEILACDMSLPESAQIIFDWCSGKHLPVNILCCAAGLGGSKDFQDLPLDDVRTMIDTNLASSIALSFLFIPMLRQSAPAYILHLGSMAGFAPIPIKSVYAATKGALYSFSCSLRQLIKEDQISVSCACPGPVFTKPEIEKETIKQLGWMGQQMAIQSADAGEIIVRGMLKGHMTIIPGKLAKIYSFLLRMLPDPFIATVLYAFRKPSG
jgi:short-subunit dehydrogenase